MENLLVYELQDEAEDTYSESIDRDSVQGVYSDLDDSLFDGEQVYGAMPYDKWGNPWASNYNSTYVVKVNFMGKSLYWHKWAVVPLMNVQKQLIDEGWDKKYHWEDLQTWCKRVIAGTSVASNHSWPTAIDINPRQNPIRYDNKLITDIPYRIVEIFKRYGFRWGGEYRTIKDAMHFEYLGEPVKDYVGKRVLRLKDDYMRGDDVKELQELLKYYGYNVTVDGVFGPKTNAFVYSFQASKMLAVDGIVGSNTWASLLSKQNDRILKLGMEGNDVLWIKKVLTKIKVTNWDYDKLGGEFDKPTENAVKRFQKATGLEEDGIVGPNTWKMLRYKSN